jgi:preprotein translocase subunit SecE
MEEGEVAESKRRGEDAVDEHLDEVFVDAVDDDAQDDFDDESFDDDEAQADDDAGSRVNGRKSSAVAKSKTGKGSSMTSIAKPVSASPGVFERIVRFIREVVAELQKVNWPSRNELITYTSVVVVFVVIMMLIVAGLDWVFALGVTHVFG